MRIALAISISALFVTLPLDGARAQKQPSSPSEAATQAETGQPAEAGKTNDEQLAERYYKLGEELYGRSDYEGALAQFRQAYQHAAKPALLFNIARCLESLGNYEDALKAFGAYLQTNPPNAEQVAARLENLKKLIARKKREEQQAQTVGGADRVPRSIHHGSLWGWVVASTGVATVITGVVLGVLAKAKANEVEDANAANEEYANFTSVEKTGKALATSQAVLLGVGGAAAVTGAVLLFLHYRKARRERSSAWLAPTISPQGALLSAGFQF